MNSPTLAMPPYPWQDKDWSRFLQLAERNQLPHAWILVGQPGLGALPLAQAMAHYLVCSAPLEGLACYRCKSCALVNSSTHPDINVIQVEEGSKAIKIEQIRTLVSQLGHTAQQGGRKIVIIDSAEAMNINAANALLKNLEEPAENTHFILLNHQLSQLLPTLRSRCMIMKLGQPSLSLSQHWLEERGFKDSVKWLELADGAPLLLLDWMENGLLEQRQAVEEGLVKLLEQRQSPLVISRDWLNFDLMVVLNSMIYQLEVALKSQAKSMDETQAVSPIMSRLQQVNPRALYGFLDRLLEKKRSIIGPSNPNTELLINELLMDWSELISPPGRQSLPISVL